MNLINQIFIYDFFYCHRMTRITQIIKFVKSVKSVDKKKITN